MRSVLFFYETSDFEISDLETSEVHQDFGSLAGGTNAENEWERIPLEK
jgi:hypothetical protein